MHLPVWPLACACLRMNSRCTRKERLQIKAYLEYGFDFGCNAVANEH